MPAKANHPTLIDDRILKAQSNPIRAEILNILSEGPNSPSKMQKRMEGVSLGLVCHHVRVLLEVELIELVEVRMRGNRKEHIYRATQRQFFNAEEWEFVDPRFKDPIIGGILRQISNDTGRAAAEGRFSEIADSHLSRAPVELDRTGWEEVTEALAQALEKVLAADVNSKERARAQVDDLMVARVVIMQFPIGRDDLQE